MGDTYHLHSADVLLLFNIDVSQIQPDVADIGCGLPHLRKHVTSLSEVTLMGKDSTWAKIWVEYSVLKNKQI